MPNITFSFEDLCSLVGKKLGDDELIRLLDCAKAEIEAKLSSEITVKFNDTNQPYLWSVEGLARLFRASLGKSKGVPALKLEKSDLVVNVDKSVASVRPFIACFLAKGQKLSEYQLAQLIQLQEKLAENFGKRRSKVGVGLFPTKGMQFPIAYKAVAPDAVKFVPLGMREEISLREVLAKHQKGKEYAGLLKGASKYPVVLSGKGEVLTFPPIINSEKTGRVRAGDDEVFCEVTGTDETAVNLVSTIFAYTLADRGFKIFPAKVKYGARSVQTPMVAPHEFKFDLNRIVLLLGIDLAEKEVKSLLERAQFNYLGKGKVQIPAYRKDVMHEVDVVEDVGIMYGFGNFVDLPLKSYTTGGLKENTAFIDLQRMLWIGFGYQEALSPFLSNKELLYNKMNVQDSGTVEIENYSSMTYSCVRTWILPVLMEILSKNKHVDYPQKLMEQGLVTIRGKELRDEEHLAAVSAHSSASFTEMKQAIESVLRSSGLQGEFEEFDHGSFIPGRAAKVLVDKVQVGFLGEIHPAVLEKFGVIVPVAACELNLSELFAKKK